MLIAIADHEAQLLIRSSTWYAVMRQSRSQANENQEEIGARIIRRCAKQTVDIAFTVVSAGDQRWSNQSKQRSLRNVYAAKLGQFKSFSEISVMARGQVIPKAGSS